MKNDNFRFVIDIVKWRKAVEVVVKSRAARYEEFKIGIDKYCSKVEGKDGMSILLRQGFTDYMDMHYADQLTKLYSIRAHARGRVHRKSARLTHYEYGQLGYKLGYENFTEANGEIKFDLTIKDQATYLGDSWKEYVKEVELNEFELAEFNSIKK